MRITRSPFAISRRLVQSYVHSTSSRPLLYATMNDVCLTTLNRKAEEEFLVFKQQGIRKSYHEFYQEARNLAAGFVAMGMDRGDRIGIWSHNYYEWALTYFATAIAGMVQVNLNPSYQANELKYALEKVGVRMVIAPKQFKHQKYYQSLVEVIPEIVRGKPGHGAVRSHDLPELKHVVIFGENEHVPGAWSFDEIVHSAGSMQDHKRVNELIDLGTPDDICNIQMTSGTTGNPKAVTLSHFNLVNNGREFGYVASLDKPGNVLCLPNPLFHCFGCVAGLHLGIVHGVKVVSPSIAYNSTAVLTAIHEERCTYILGAPTMFIDILAEPNLKKYDLTSMRGGVVGAAPVPEALARQMTQELHMPELLIGYGCTECSPMICLGDPNMPIEERVKTVGQPCAHTEVKVIDPASGKIVERGQKGEICVRGHNVMRGYWAGEGKKELGEDRWYRTGDVGTMDESGNVAIVGRTKDLIIRGGENIYPAEVEQFLFKFPYIEDAHIVGVPDERHGEAVCAWIRLHADFEGKITEEQIINDCKDKIAYYKIPKYILIKKHEDFPLTETGKVKKNELRELSKHLLGLDASKDHFNR